MIRKNRPWKEGNNMKIIISPAKKMRVDEDTLAPRSLPRFLDRAAVLLDHLKGLSYEELKKLLACGDDIASLNFERFRHMDLAKGNTPAIWAYDGIQYQYMGAQVLSEDELAYLGDHLRILSGFYGLLCPFDGVVPYRLEMQARLKTDFCKNLYDFWGDSLARAVTEDGCDAVLNLASEEYAKAVRRHIGGVPFIDVTFGERSGGRIREKGVYVKMARGAMTRFLAEKKADSVEAIKDFADLGFHYHEELSDERKYVFLMEKEQEGSHGD